MSFFLRIGVVGPVVFVLLTFGACAAPARLPEPQPKASAAQARPVHDAALEDLAHRIAEKYGNAKYISYTSRVEVHEVLAPGWRVQFGKGIAPGTRFEVLMSAAGDIRTRLFENARLTYEFQVAAEQDADSGEKRYAVREYDHVRRVRSEVRRLEHSPDLWPLADEALGPAARCASGGYVETMVGPNGKVANAQEDWSVSSRRIAHGSLLDYDEGGIGGNVVAVKTIQRTASPPAPRPDGGMTPAFPAIWWNIFVDRDAALILGQDGYFQFPGRDPILVRRKRFENIKFPAYIDPAVFSAVPEEALSYQVWKVGEPYPGNDRAGGSVSGNPPSPGSPDPQSTDRTPP